jgi:hypothetical protein
LREEANGDGVGGIIAVIYPQGDVTQSERVPALGCVEVFSGPQEKEKANPNEVHDGQLPSAAVEEGKPACFEQDGLRNGAFAHRRRILFFPAGEDALEAEVGLTDVV